jgi:hypothetical protein
MKQPPKSCGNCVHCGVYPRNNPNGSSMCLVMYLIVNHRWHCLCKAWSHDGSTAGKGEIK